MSDLNQSKSNSLKPCPFCGGQPTLSERKSYSNTKWYRVICLNSMCLICPSTAEFEDKENAIRAWNRRTEKTKNE